MLFKVNPLFLLAGFLALGPSLVLAQATPQDFDIRLVPQKKTFRQGEDVLVNSVITVRATGCAGWSYGVKHDPTKLDVISATTVGTDVPPLFSSGFNVTDLIEENSVNTGWIQAIVLSFVEKRELPITPAFVMAKSVYKVKTGICDAPGTIPTSIVYTNELHVENSPPVEINLTVNGKSVKPAVQEPAELTLDCPAPAALDLSLQAALAVNRKLTADRNDVLGINVSLKNNASAGGDAAEVQGWSYGLKVDTALLEVVDVTTAPHAMAVNGGLGPDFRAYNFNPPEQSSNGQVKGLTVGVVVALDPPNDVLAVPATESRDLEQVKVRSAIVIPSTGADRTTNLDFVSEVLGNPLIENIITVRGLSVTPKSEAPAVLVVLTGAAAPEPTFKRGDSNDDGRFDVADAVKIIRVLFYQDGQLVCRDAADTNDDGRLDLADAIYIIQWQFLGSLKPPAAPWPNCGSDPTPDTPTTLNCGKATKGCS